MAPMGLKGPQQCTLTDLEGETGEGLRATVPQATKRLTVGNGSLHSSSWDLPFQT